MADKQQDGFIGTVPLACLLASASLLVSLVVGRSPWGWPDLDMATYYVNVQSPGFIANDFFTRCFQGDNGRGVFGALTAWPIGLGLDWFQTLQVWKLLLSSCAPAAVYAGLRAVLRPANILSQCILLFFILIVVFANAQLYLSVAWWPGLASSFHPLVFCIFLLFLGLYFHQREQRKPLSILFSYVLILLAALMHPAYAVGGGIFVFIVLLFLKGKLLDAILFQLPILAALVFYRVSFSVGTLPLEDYVAYFAWLHPEHYIPSRFMSPMGMAWYLPVVVISAALAVSAFVLARKGRGLVWLLPVACLVYYDGSLLAQYLLVERHPLFASVVLISPSRFLAFGYWMVVVAAVAVGDTLALPAGWRPLHWPLWHRIRRAGVVAAGPCVVVALGLAVWTVVGLKGPWERISADERTLLRWISANTRPTDEIASGDTLPVDIPLLTGRATYVGNGFPFSDRCLAENYRRYVNLRGVPTGPQGRQQAAEHFRGLNLDQIRALTPRPDWVVMRADSDGARQSLAAAAPSFANARFVMFKVEPPAGRH